MPNPSAFCTGALAGCCLSGLGLACWVLDGAGLGGGAGLVRAAGLSLSTAPAFESFSMEWRYSICSGSPVRRTT